MRGNFQDRLPRNRYLADHTKPHLPLFRVATTTEYLVGTAMCRTKSLRYGRYMWISAAAANRLTVWCMLTADGATATALPPRDIPECKWDSRMTSPWPIALRWRSHRSVTKSRGNQRRLAAVAVLIRRSLRRRLTRAPGLVLPTYARNSFGMPYVLLALRERATTGSTRTAPKITVHS